MAAPAGGAGGSRGAAVSQAAAPSTPDPRRPRPSDKTMAEFLMQIGSEHRPLPQDTNRRYAIDGEAQMKEALRLGDIIKVGDTEEEKEGELVVKKSYPIYQIARPQGNEGIKFTLDPYYRGQESGGYPPDIEYAAGRVYMGMENALWAVFRYDNPTQIGSVEKFEDLVRGMDWRYAGENQVPQPLPDIGYALL